MLEAVAAYLLVSSLGHMEEPTGLMETVRHAEIVLAILTEERGNGGEEGGKEWRREGIHQICFVFLWITRTIHKSIFV